MKNNIKLVALAWFLIFLSASLFCMEQPIQSLATTRITYSDSIIFGKRVISCSCQDNDVAKFLKFLEDLKQYRVINNRLEVLSDYVIDITMDSHCTNTMHYYVAELLAHNIGRDSKVIVHKAFCA